MRTILLVLSFSVCAFALQDLNYPNNFSAGDTIRAANFQSNNDSLENLWARNQDSLDAAFIRFSDLEDGDTTLDSLRVNAIRGNPDIDSAKGNPRIDSVNVGYINTDSIKGPVWFDSVSSNIVFTGSPVLDNPLDVDSLFSGTGSLKLEAPLAYKLRLVQKSVTLADDSTLAYESAFMSVTVPDGKDTLRTVTGGAAGDILIIRCANADTLLITNAAILYGFVPNTSPITVSSNGSIAVFLNTGYQWLEISHLTK